MESLEVCGCNYRFAISETPRDKGQYEYQIVYPPMPSKFTVSSISSYSTYYNKTIIVTKDGLSYIIGDNTKYQISYSFANKIFDQFTPFEFRSKDNSPCNILSAVCGTNYILYLVTELENNTKNQLAFSHTKINNQSFPIFLNIGSFNPVSLFGGDSDCAAIDSNGSIIYINESLLKKLQTTEICPVFLPDGEKAVSIAWYKDYIIVLSKSGRVFDSKRNKNPTFSEVSELNGIEIVCISGVLKHAIAVSRDNRVFVIGENKDGQLGFGQKSTGVRKFTENLSLVGLNIVEAYAGSYHSLFKTVNGKIYACGYNVYGQLLLKSGPGNHVYDPTETLIENASFCIAGGGSSVIFRNYIPPMNPNKKMIC